MSSREVFDTIPPGRFRDDRARPPRVRAVPARATGPAATGTATEAPASVFPGRARALPPRSTLAERRGSQPHPGRGRPAGARHATCRAFRSRATARARSARSLARRTARLDRVRVTRGSALRSAREGRRRAHCGVRALLLLPRDWFESETGRVLGPQVFRARVGKNISFHFLCSGAQSGKTSRAKRRIFPESTRNRLRLVHTFYLRTTRKGESVAFFPEQRERTNARRGETEPKRSSDVTRATVARGHSRSL